MNVIHLFRAILVLSTVLILGCKEKSKSASTLINETVASKEDPVVDIEIIPIEHASAVLIMDDITIYIDPVGKIDYYNDVPEPDLILITDIHGDHFSLETLEALNTQKSKIILPQAVAEKLPEKFTPQIDILNNGDQKERFGINVEAIPMYNLREEAKDFHPKGRGNGYVISKNNQRIYFSGDTEDIPEMRGLSHIDKAFICMNLPYTMTVESAADAVLEFRPKQVYPYHYRGKPDVSDVTLFNELIKKERPDIEVVQLDWYPREDY
ncbi:MBL fold metallo-hydrolase [Arenibacter certesii]|uniref:Metal-dependent hydrolase n=1 Tax=Arenibacter certesii TaxID=228955 RepID=A0A918IV50_9FLAO|nr:MBL fold metallo-hydrolase [Arenibacter certesii]GGW32195.1 metal-dependent hydrolase [Arenibacter certesii]